LFPEIIYRPVAHIQEGLALKTYAGCCMDTSDGVLTTLDQLMRINGYGFEIHCNWEKLLNSQVLKFCQKTKTPPWLMLAGPHGEFELIFTLSAAHKNALARKQQNPIAGAIKVGKVTKTPEITWIPPSGKKIKIDMAIIRNLLDTVEGDLDRYIKEFRSLGKKWGLEDYE
jgi:thiamine-monophosphate kinase